MLAKFIMLMLRGEQPTMYGDGEQSRDFTYIDNVVSANLRACSAPAAQVAGPAMNVATGSRITLNKTFEILKEMTRYSGTAHHGPERAGDIKHSLADISLAGKLMGYKPVVGSQKAWRAPWPGIARRRGQWRCASGGRAGLSLSRTCA